MEGAEWVYVDGKFERQVDAARKTIMTATSINLEEQKILAFDHFLRSIK